MSDPTCRHLVIVLGDQLDAGSSAFDGFDPSCDAVWMAEVDGEARHVRSTKARIAMFLSAMRHFASACDQAGWTVRYRRIDEAGNRHSLPAELEAEVRRARPSRLVVVEPGEYRLAHALRTLAGRLDVELDIRPDRSFYRTAEQFAEFAAGRKQLLMESFYRQVRRAEGVLMDADTPAGGRWNFDKDNRASFGRSGPGEVPARASFAPDEITREVIAAVNDRFADQPGTLDDFDWPTTPAQASAALGEFVAHRLSRFGDVQDAMWTGEPFLYHSQLSAAMNLKLLDPRTVVAAAQRAWREGRAPLNAVEGFVRQIVGWREFVRGVYWHAMPEYLSSNALGAECGLPWFYWTGETDAACLRESIGQTLRLGYAHHIQRLMVTGLFALLLGVRPREVHQWYLGVYVDAVEWVEAPNVLGMSQYADGGLVASKPYAATGKYIDRMSNYCRSCPYRPGDRTSERACPFTALYWDFLLRHQRRFRQHPRLGLQVKNLDRLDRDERRRIRRRAATIRDQLAASGPTRRL